MNETAKTYQEKIEELINQGGVAACIAMSLEKFRPVSPDTAPKVHLSSVEIVNVMEDICQATTNDVAEVMVYLGYRLNRTLDSAPEWGLEPVKE